MSVCHSFAVDSPTPRASTGVDPGRSPCRLCLETYRSAQRGEADAVLTAWPRVLRAERPNRATGPIAQMLGALVSMEALRYLTGLMPPVSAGTYQLIDFASDCSISSDSWPQDPNCLLCTVAPAREHAQVGMAG